MHLKCLWLQDTADADKKAKKSQGGFFLTQIGDIENPRFPFLTHTSLFFSPELITCWSFFCFLGKLCRVKLGPFGSKRDNQASHDSLPSRPFLF